MKKTPLKLRPYGAIQICCIARVLAAGEWQNEKNDKIAETKGAQRRAQVETIWIKFGIRVLDVPGAIKCANFGDDSLKGFWLGDQISPFLIGFRRCYDNTLALPRKCVDWCTSWYACRWYVTFLLGTTVCTWDLRIRCVDCHELDCIHRMEWRHRVYGHDTIAILWA